MIFLGKNTHLRVVILHPGLRAKFWRKICIFPGSDCTNAPFFLKRHYIEELQKINLFFPWRSTYFSYWNHHNGKYRKKTLFRLKGGFEGNTWTPGERTRKYLHLVELSPPKPSCSLLLQILRIPNFKSWNFEMLAHFRLNFTVQKCCTKITQNKPILRNFRIWTSDFSRLTKVMTKRLN